MTVSKENQSLGVAQAGETLGLSEHTVRYYERAGLLDSVPRTASGRRVFRQAELDRLKFVSVMRRTGMPIRVLRQYIQTDPEAGATKHDRRDILANHRESVQSQLLACQEALEIIDRKIAMFDAGTLYEPQEETR
jgi:DNA-binding transcriptional MerR regulator